MQNFSTKTLFALFTVSLIVFLSSCLPDVEDPASQLQVGVQVKNIDTTLTSGNDSLTVDRVRLIHGQSSIVIDEDSTLFLTGQILQLTFESKDQNIVLIYPFRGATGPFPEGVYEGLTYEIIKASEDEDIINLDPEFREGGPYSIIINGTYNGASFTFKSTQEFTYPFEFIPPVSVPATNEIFSFIISANVRQWFSNSQGGFYDPRGGTNNTAINDNIALSFTIEQKRP